MSKESIKTTIPLAVIDRIMRENLPANKISRDAKIEFDKVLVKLAKAICENAKTSAEKAKRKTVMPEDIKFE
ncbi:MAG: NFYB/HAP3 family transcription factor subunit [Candidatus Heimdallarchaeota archaeon]|nr:NFYB/HAP3 family transcription factor subunit [Candidatus Heimdallarchaeota archaeon]